MIDLVFPKNNEKEFIELARTLGIKLCFCYSSFDIKRDYSDAYYGYFCKEKAPDKIKTEINRAKKLFDIVIFKSSTSKLNRFVLEHTNIDLIFSLENNNAIDSVNNVISGLNQVVCEIASKRKIIVALNFNDILNLDRVKLLSRMTQNIELARKYSVPIVILSFARDYMELRSKSELKSVLNVLGASTKQSFDAFNVVSERISLNQKKRNNLATENVEIIG